MTRAPLILASPPAPPPPAADPVCPCESFVHPRTLFNPPARSAIDYRVGDFLAFRHALLLSLPGEAELSGPDGPIWRPAPGDLGLQLVEWWAVCADILTFYNQRIASQAYLRTADEAESLRRLIRLLGYRPRPGIGAHGLLAAVGSGTAPFTLPAAFPIQSKPGPGKQPQTFELEADTPVPAPFAITADPVGAGALAGDDGQSVLLQGRIASLKPADRLLLLPRGWAGGTDTDYQLVSVQAVAPTHDPRGRPLTRVTFTAPLALPAGAQATDYRLLRSVQTARLWPYATSVSATSADLDSAVRSIHIGDPVLFEVASSGLAAMRASVGGRATIGTGAIVVLHPPRTTLVSVTSYSEAVWYVVADPSDPTKPATDQGPNFIPVGLLHSTIGFSPALTGDPVLWDLDKSLVTIRHDWRDVGTLVTTPPRRFAGGPGQLAAPADTVFPVGTYPVLLEGADGSGAAATATVLGNDPTVMTLSDLPDPPVPLAAPVTVLTGLLPVSRGKTVTNEVLGSGDPRIASQGFTLRNAPLTYLQSAASLSGETYRSTLTVWVDGIAWTEVANFYGQPADARVFMTREDESDHTQILFGDGIHGARLPTGVNNVVARYRYGSGAEAPEAGTLTVLAQPWPGLRAVRNPVAVGGGADPDPAERIRQDAPRSVLTFGRAVSLDDHAAIALAAPGVARARAEWVFDGAAQRAAVTVWVGDDQAARDAAQAALEAAIDPNRPVRVALAIPTPVRLAATIVIDPRYAIDPVLAAVRAALLDPDAGLFGVARTGIGRSVYDSEIHAACLAVAGVRAVRDLAVTVAPCPGQKPKTLSKSLIARARLDVGMVGTLLPGVDPTLCTGTHRHDPCAGGFFTLAAADLDLAAVPDDGSRPDD